MEATPSCFPIVVDLDAFFGGDVSASSLDTVRLRGLRLTDSSLVLWLFEAMVRCVCTDMGRRICGDETNAYEGTKQPMIQTAATV